MKRMALILSRDLGSAGGSPAERVRVERRSLPVRRDRLLVSDLLRTVVALLRSQTAGEPPALTDRNCMNRNTHNVGRWKLWLLLVFLVALTLAIVAIPVFVIMPFKSQTSAGVAWSFWLRRLSRIVTVMTTMIALGLCWRLWRGARWWSRLAMPLLLVPVFAATWMARQNHFEWMFNPLPNPAYAKASEATFIADTDMVMAVEINGESVAYPVRQMAYHHVVQDAVGGKPITATY